MEIRGMKHIIGIVGGMLAFTFILAIVFLILVSKFPKCMIYTGLVLAAIILVALGIALLASGVIIGAVMIFGLLALSACLLYCFREQLEQGIVLLKVTGDFLLEKPTVFLAPFFVGIFVVIFFLFWVASLVAIMLNYPEE